MISIQTERTKSAAKKHFKGLKDQITSRLIKRKNSADVCLSAVDYLIFEELINMNLERILIGDISSALTCWDTLNIFVTDTGNLIKDVEYVFDYSWFRGYKKTLYNGFDLAYYLSIDVCPYCNRNYTTSHRINSKNKNVFPEFDHFYPKTDFPLLALSFYNLIPSCNICNTHFKGSINPDDNNLLNPYTDINIAKHYKFTFTPNDYDSLLGKGDNFSLDMNTLINSPTAQLKEKIDSSFAFFGIKETYELNHKGLIKDLLNKRIANSDGYIQSLAAYGISFNEAYRILFETYFEDEKLYKRPFSKLKKDLFNEVKSSRFKP
ncbi:hypothetical protein [Flavobacterium wongokense]|uniref:hypothetical protein n=1 Tax=Flavobacterium wongokense TaxID=2910674 RepID=UPI001F3A99F1|nr:hypothetical protein [Flavobacterium sp. WG47]MCF6131711.1 hypothetical protein [Flavobacterium sp. WG47]